MKLGQYGAALGITRWIPSLAESDAIKAGTLSEKEKEIYRAVFYQKTATVTMIDEVKAVKQNANIVKENGIPQVPMLLFISDGSGGTGFTKEKWRSIPENYISGCDNAGYIELDCPHYVHDYKYDKISKERRNEAFKVHKKCLEGYHKQKLPSKYFYDVVSYIKYHDDGMLQKLGNKRSRIEILFDKISEQETENMA